MMKMRAVVIFTALIGIVVLVVLPGASDVPESGYNCLVAQQDLTIIQVVTLRAELSAAEERIDALEGWIAALTGSADRVLPAVADVVASVKPSVVAIHTETTIQTFHRFYSQSGAGSGWIIDERGVVLTNAHVVAGVDSIYVTLDDGRTLWVDPSSVAIDSASDLATFLIDAENLPAATVGDSSALRVGDWVVAIGNPLGLGVSAKEGIVSRLDVSLAIEGQTLEGFIETSAAINPGNSGGPLVNMKGEVIGITSAKIAATGVEGLGYAIGVSHAISIIQELAGDFSAVH